MFRDNTRKLYLASAISLVAFIITLVLALSVHLAEKEDADKFKIAMIAFSALFGSTSLVTGCMAYLQCCQPAPVYNPDDAGTPKWGARKLQKMWATSFRYEEADTPPGILLQPFSAVKDGDDDDEENGL